MLLLPILLGVAASRPDPWQAVLTAAAVCGYLVSATFQAWARSRRARDYLAPLAVYGLLFAIVGVTLTIRFPALLLALLVIVPAAMVVFGGARPGTPRDLANSLAQVVQALVLVPAAAHVSGAWDPERVVGAAVVAAAYLVGSVLVVRSVLRERGNEAFAAVSVGVHAGFVVGTALAAAWLSLPVAYVLGALWLAVRAAGLPVAQRRLAGGPRPLRPIHVGVVEIVSSVLVVVIAFAAPV
jgi:hypothetical protein